MAPVSSRTDGDRWVDCRCGQRHWGRYGAAGLLLHAGPADRAAGGQRVLLQHRAAWSHNGGTWGIPGGARASGETALAAALREAAEEAGVPGDAVRPERASVEDHGDWSYTTVVAASLRAFEPVADDESERLAWVPVGDVGGLDLHPAFGRAWPGLRERLGTRLVLVVDGANVVGSRPDGWWRDRAGAAARLGAGLAALATGAGLPTSLLEAGESALAATWWPQVVLVLEGAARPAATRIDPAVRVVAAAGSGDDAVVAEVSRRRAERPADVVVVATADRGLRRRLAAYDVVLLGPGALRELLDGGRGDGPGSSR